MSDKVKIGYFVVKLGVSVVFTYMMYKKYCELLGVDTKSKRKRKAAAQRKEEIDIRCGEYEIH